MHEKNHFSETTLGSLCEPTSTANSSTCTSSSSSSPDGNNDDARGNVTCRIYAASYCVLNSDIERGMAGHSHTSQGFETATTTTVTVVYPYHHESSTHHPSTTTRPPHYSASSTTSSTSHSSTSKPKVCEVCGDKAKSYHFGGLSCDSCKAFFRRSVQNDGYNLFQCAYNENCIVTVHTRKACQYCRFHKCLNIGMEKTWVMSDDERNVLNQQRMERKSRRTETGRHTETCRQTRPLEHTGPGDFVPDVGDLLNHMTMNDKATIDAVVHLYQQSYRDIPYTVSKGNGCRSPLEIIQMFTTILRRFAYFTRELPEFQALKIADQTTLLRASVLEMCLLRSALSYDAQNNRWPNNTMGFLKGCPRLRVEDMEKLVSKELYELHLRFIQGIQDMKVDEATIMLLLLIVLFHAERPGLHDVDTINTTQEKFLLLLNKYVQWRYGPVHGPKIYPKLLTKLSDLRELNDTHTEYNLRLAKTEVEQIQEQLGRINLNPYPQWELVKSQDVSQDAPQQGYQQFSSPSGNFPGRSQASSFFRQMVQQRIPSLIKNPMASLPFEFEAFREHSRMSYSAPPPPLPVHGAFQEETTAGESSLEQPNYPTTHPIETLQMENQELTPGRSISHLKDMLAPRDPGLLRQLQESLSSDMLQRLSNVFGEGGVAEVTGTPNYEGRECPSSMSNPNVCPTFDRGMSAPGETFLKPSNPPCYHHENVPMPIEQHSDYDYHRYASWEHGHGASEQMMPTQHPGHFAETVQPSTEVMTNDPGNVDSQYTTLHTVVPRSHPPHYNPGFPPEEEGVQYSAGSEYHQNYQW